MFGCLLFGLRGAEWLLGLGCVVGRFAIVVLLWFLFGCDASCFVCWLFCLICYCGW